MAIHMVRHSLSQTGTSPWTFAVAEIFPVKFNLYELDTMDGFSAEDNTYMLVDKLGIFLQHDVLFIS